MEAVQFNGNEKYLSQIPALQLLINLGYQYLTPAQALAERQGKSGNVLLENILREQLKRLNRIHYKGREFLFSEENIQSAIQKLKSVKYDGLQRTNEAIYDLITLYSALEGFDEADLAGALISVRDEVDKLPQRYSDLWDLFKEVKNSYDEEAAEVHLADPARREDFYQRLAEYRKTLGIALSTAAFVMQTDEAKLRRYKDDLKYFQKLRAAVKLRYAETIDYRDFEPKIKKLLDTHIQANEVIQLNEPAKPRLRIRRMRTRWGSLSQSGVPLTTLDQRCYAPSRPTSRSRFTPGGDRCWVFRRKTGGSRFSRGL